MLEQRRSALDAGSGPGPIIGAMLESYLEPGKQPIASRREDLKYGVSITDACLGWSQTETLLRAGAASEKGWTGALSSGNKEVADLARG